MSVVRSFLWSWKTVRFSDWNKSEKHFRKYVRRSLMQTSTRQMYEKKPNRQRRNGILRGRKIKKASDNKSETRLFEWFVIVL